MKSIIDTRFLAAAALALGAFGAASAAHARSDVYFSVGVQGAPGVYVQPQPVYVQPAPVYVQPAPVYVQPRHGYVAPAAVYDRGYGGYDRGYGGYGGYYRQDRHEDGRAWRHARRHGPWGDFDGDGVVNRQDRFPGNPYRY